MLFLTLLIPVTLFISCNKIDLGDTEGNSSSFNPGIGAKVNSNVSGFITGETDEPIAGATVIVGNSTVVTDDYGYFEANEATVNANAAVVTVIKAGYFKGIKTFNADGKQDAFFRIKLIPKTNAGTVSGINGGNVALHNGLKVSFPNNGIVNATTGAAYGGTVNVAAYWINPAANDINKIMPGDLRGENANGDLRKLSSYGMAAVELTGASGELLQVAPGKKATITMPMASSISANAPASIPLWYFNEETGIWQEQGSAVRQGNTYVGDVTHFSFWNCDTEESMIEFNCTVQYPNGNPVNHALVKISAVNDPTVAGWGYTNAQGYVSGIVPSNRVLRLDIIGDASCGYTPIYTETFTAANNNVSLPLITINAVGGIATVSGTIKDCDNKTVSKGGIIMQKNYEYYIFPVDKNGGYSFTTALCNSTAEVSLMAYDADKSAYGDQNNYTITAGINTTIDMQACGHSSNQFINYTINGVPYSFTYPAASFAPVTPGSHFTFSVTNALDTEQASFMFASACISNNNTNPLSYFNASQVNGSLTLNSPILVNITEHGTNDQFFAGNFSGQFRGPDNTPYTITCSFRVKCQL